MKPMPLILYGIPNCDTVKKARVWLDAHKIAYSFHDYKKSGVDKAHLERWCTALGWETVLNRAGTTFKALPDADKTGLNQAKAVALMGTNPSMIKRPILESETQLMAGFKPDQYEAAFA